MTIDIEKLTPSDCNCTLACSHSYGGGRVRNYQMNAVNLGLTKTGKVKLLVFGKMYWKNTDDKRSIRYVEKERVTKIAPAPAQYIKSNPSSVNGFNPKK